MDANTGLSRARVVVLATSAAGAALLATCLVRRQRHGQGKGRRAGFGVSSRGMRLNLPSLSYIGGVIDFKDPYQAESLRSIEGSDDWAFMALAENKLMWADILKPRALRALQSLPDSSASYVPMQGHIALRQALSEFLERHVVKVPVSPEELVCGTGVSAVLSNLFYCICEEGDLVLIPAPYYSAFDSDLRAFSNLRRVLVPLNPEAGYRLTVEALEAAYKQALLTTGRVPKALLLTNPHNPLGRIAPRDELEAVLAWCTSKGLHLVSDEIYALSCFEKQLRCKENSSQTRNGETHVPTFVSVAELCRGRLSDHVHVIWGVSKDFGMAGVRVGMVWSQNYPLLEALRNAAKFTSISGPIQAMVTELLTDEDFVEMYLRENRRRLLGNCEVLLRCLDDLDISYVVPEGGLFVWVDMRLLLACLARTEPGLPAEMLEAELHERLKNELHIVITPGSTQHAYEPGWFRICYASLASERLRNAMGRFAEWVAALRREALEVAPIGNGQAPHVGGGRPLLLQPKVLEC